MTSDDPLLSVPDDDALDAAAMAVADGVATSEEEAAVAAAPDGAARVAAQRAVAKAVGAPAGEQDPHAAVRARAAALAAFGAEPAPGDPSVASVVPLPPPRSKRTLPRLGAVAAALLLLVGIGTFAVALTRSGGSDDATTFAAAPPAKESAEQATRSAADAGVAAPTSPGTALRGDTTPPPVPPAPGPVIGSAGGTSPEAAAASGPPPPPPPATVNGGDLGRQDDLEGVALQARKALDGAPSVLAAPGDPALPSDVRACITAAATTAPETLGALRYRATGTFEGAAAFFLAFDRPSNAASYYLVTIARDGCAILGFTHF